MQCTSVTLSGGGRMIVCGQRRRLPLCGCGDRAPLLCDWKVGPSDATCSKPICCACSTKPAPDKDLCPEHAVAWTAWKAQRGFR